MKLIFDIGANNGNTVEFYKNISEKVVCFEPNLDLVKGLKKRFENDNVIVDDRGLSDQVGEKKFMISNANTISTFSESWVNDSRFSKSYNWDQSIIVKTTTLDSIIEEYGIPDFVKIDVEGYEYEVLKGLTKLLSETTFAFEWAEEQYPTILLTIEHLKKIGYSQYGFTYKDEPTIGEKIEFGSWDTLDIHSNINPQRKDKWGMIYFKK
jgi:FkbM family methyltransferase